jgi:cytidylate kinase
MASEHHLERLSGALEQHYYTHREAAETAPPFTVALSREAGVPDAAVASEVGRRLDWPVYDHELLERIAEEMHLSPSVLRQIDERPRSWLVERLHTFMAKPAVSEPAYVERLIRTLLSLSALGHCVVVGRGSPHLLPSAATLRVRLVAPLKDRIAFLTRQEGISHDRAAERVAALDRDRAEFARRHFQVDPADPHHCDLLLNCARFGVGECADLIIEALHRMEHHAPAERAPSAAMT